MSVSTTIKNQLKAKIQTCASIQTVYGHEELNPTGFPAVFLVAANMEGEFSSNAENSRLYAYRVTVLFPVGSDFAPPNNQDRMEYAEQVIATSVDEIINAVDTNFTLDGSPVLYVNASDVEWGYVDYEGGVGKIAQLTLRVYTEKTVL